MKPLSKLFFLNRVYLRLKEHIATKHLNIEFEEVSTEVDRDIRENEGESTAKTDETMENKEKDEEKKGNKEEEIGEGENKRRD